MSSRTFTTHCRSSYCPDTRNGEQLRDAEYCDSWIAPDGRQFYVSSVSHSHVAYEHGLTSDTVLEAEGWMHFSLAWRMPVANVERDATWRPTQAQMDRLFDIMMAAATAPDDGHNIKPIEHHHSLAEYLRKQQEG